MEEQEIKMTSSSENITEPSNVKITKICEIEEMLPKTEKKIENEKNLNISVQSIEISKEKNIEQKLAEPNSTLYLAPKTVNVESIKSDLIETSFELETKSATNLIEENWNPELEKQNLNAEVESKFDVQIGYEIKLFENKTQLESNSDVSKECSRKPESLIGSEQNIKLMESSTIISTEAENKLELIDEEKSDIETVTLIESEEKEVTKGKINLQINQAVDNKNMLVSDSEEYLMPEYEEIRSHNKSTNDILECDITAQCDQNEGAGINDLMELSPKKNYDSINDDSDEDEDEDDSSEVDEEDEEDIDEEDEDPENNSEDDDEEEERSTKKSKYEDNNDEVMILDSSDEEENRRSPSPPPLPRSRPGPASFKKSQKDNSSMNNYYDEEPEDSEADESDEESSSEIYDDNDLMDMAVLASAGPSTSTQSVNRKSIKKNKNFDDSLRNIQSCSKRIKHGPNKPQIRRKLKRRIDQIDFRCIMKNFSIKCLNSRKMHNVGEIDFHPPSTSAYHNRENHQMSLDENSFYDSPVNSEFLTPGKKNDVIELESSTEKSQTSKSDKMQPVEKIRETIQKSEDLKEQEILKSANKDDEQNKENLENNEKIISNILNDKSEEIKCHKIEEPEEEKNNGTETDKEEESFKSCEDKTLVFTEIEESTQKMETENGDKSIKIQEILNTGNKLITDDCSGDINKKSEICNDNLVISAVKSIAPTELSRKRSRSEDNDNLRSSGTGITSTPIQPKIPKPSIDVSSPASTTIQESKEDIHPTKKLRAELETNFRIHDRILSEYIERSSNETPEHIDNHVSQLALEIQTLNNMIKDKEIEWNNLLNLKKCKEEICYRLTRKKQTLEIMNKKVGEVPPLEQSPPDVSKLANMKIPQIDQINSSLVAAMTAATGNSSSNLFNFKGNSAAQNIIQTRANMNTSDLAKEKANTQKLHRLLVSRNILPKPSGIVSPPSTQPQQEPPSVGLFGSSSTLNNLLGNNCAKQQPILNNYLTTAASVQQQLGELLNGHHNHQQNGPQNLMIGRQGVFKDVKAIIAEYRQKNADPPRRGRRLKSTNNNDIIGGSLSNHSSGLGPIRNSNSEFNQLSHKYETNSRPSSNDSSSHSLNLNGSGANLTFKDVLFQFAKMSGQNPERLAAVAAAVTANQQNGKQTNHSNFNQPPYPEVTLHPVSTTQSSEANGSLLHGILTKFTRPTNCSLSQATTTAATPTTSCAPSSTTTNFNSTFSPTLARLLTGEQRISSGNVPPTVNSGSLLNNSAAGSSGSTNASGLNLSKVVGHNSEITITPVSTTLHQSLLQHQLQHQNQLKEVLSRQASIGSTNIGASVNERLKTENFMNIDDEADDSVDRLVIDEGNDDQPQHQIRIAPNAIGQEFHENEVPVCQGCKRHEAQFVCAGCGNQWYCSRECQVNAWDDHSEVCTG